MIFPGLLSFFQVFQVFQVEWEPWLATSHSLYLNSGYATDVIGKTISQTMEEHFSTGSHDIMCIFFKLFSTRQRPSNPLGPTDNVSFQIRSVSFKNILKIFREKESFEQIPLCS